MARSPSEAFLNHETLIQLLATCDQEREQAQVATEDAQAVVERLTIRNAQLELELTSEKAQHSQLICQFERCHAELQVTAEEQENANAVLRITNEDLVRRVREGT